MNLKSRKLSEKVYHFADIKHKTTTFNYLKLELNRDRNVETFYMYFKYVIKKKTEPQNL